MKDNNIDISSRKLRLPYEFGWCSTAHQSTGWCGEGGYVATDGRRYWSDVDSTGEGVRMKVASRMYAVRPAVRCNTRSAIDHTRRRRTVEPPAPQGQCARHKHCAYSGCEPGLCPICHATETKCAGKHGGEPDGGWTRGYATEASNTLRPGQPNNPLAVQCG
jgi:hypothetical protein